MLTTVHPPFDTRIFHKESKSLLKAGHSVTIVAPHDSVDKKNVDGINIVTVKRPGSKILHPITLIRVFIAGLREDCDVYHCHEPGSLFVCILLKLLRQTKLVYDAHEHYPSLIAENTLFPHQLKFFVQVIVDKTEKSLCWFTDYIITVNVTLKNRFNLLNNTIILFNVPILTLFNKEEKAHEDCHILIYEGNVNKKRGLDKLLVSLKDIRQKIPDIKLLIVGTISDTEEFKMCVNTYIKNNNLDKNIEITNWVPHEDVIKYIKKSEIGFLLFQPTYYNNLIGLPNKLFEYMACEIPVIASDFPEIRNIVQEEKCGILLDPTDTKKITDAVIWLLDHPVEAKQMGENGRKAVEEKYNWEIMEKRLFELYEEIA
jgi:glycosyltransferase involved in cell wall biosynthesis